MSLLGLSGVLGRIAVVRTLSEKLEERAKLEAAAVVAAEARRIAPSRTGELRSSIVVEKTDDEIGVRVRAPHARFQEFGTVHIQAQHFLERAAAGVGQGILRKFTRVFQGLTRR